MSGVIIRKAALADAELIRQIAQQTFSETFSEMNSGENMQKYLDEDLSIQKIREELQNKNSEFYYAENAEKVIGYLKINFGSSQTEVKDNNAIEIERIYVLKEFHGKNVGNLLYDKAVEIAENNNVNYIWLGVWEKNPRAIRFYQKNGFVEFDKHIFKLGDDKQTDLMMKLDLK
jgi:diamine N-acetyltransferase